MSFLKTFSKKITARIYLLGLLIALLSVTGTAYYASAQDGQSFYLPQLNKGHEFAAIPQPVKTFVVPGALCPNDIVYSPVNELWYVLNTSSADVSVLNNDGTFIDALHVGGRPTAADVSQNSSYVYVSNLPEKAPPARSSLTPRPCDDPSIPGLEPACISIIDGAELIKQHDPQYEPFAVEVHPHTDEAYVTDLDSALMTFDGTSKTTTSLIDDNVGRSGWAISLTHDPQSGLTYIPSWETGDLFILDGNTIVDAFDYEGWGAHDIEIHHASGYIYIANSQSTIPGRPTNNISILRRGSQEITKIETAAESQYVAINQWNGYVYITNESSGSVTILRQGDEITTIDVDGHPRDVEVNQLTGYAFVAVPDTNKVLVFAEDELVAEYESGALPFSIGVNEENGETWVASRKSIIKYEVDRPFEFCLDDPTITVFK